MAKVVHGGDANSDNSNGSNNSDNSMVIIMWDGFGVTIVLLQ